MNNIYNGILRWISSQILDYYQDNTLITQKRTYSLYVIEHATAKYALCYPKIHNLLPRNTHFATVIQHFLKANIFRLYVERGGPLAWLPRSPELTYWNFFFWGCIKSLAYETTVDFRFTYLVVRIVVVSDEINTTPNAYGGIFDIHRCVPLGHQFQQLLKTFSDLNAIM